MSMGRAVQWCARHNETRSHALVQGMIFALASILVAGCGGAPEVHHTLTPNGSATATAVAQATAASAPVVIEVHATVQGNAEGHTVVLLSTITVHNRNTFRIALAGDCSTPPIDVVFTNPVTGFSASGSLLCSAIPAYDLKPTLPANDLHTWTLTYNYAGEAAVVAGQYTVTAHIFTWHAGTIDQLIADASTPHGSASGTTTVTVP